MGLEDAHKMKEQLHKLAAEKGLELEKFQLIIDDDGDELLMMEFMIPPAKLIGTLDDQGEVDQMFASLTQGMEMQENPVIRKFDYYQEWLNDDDDD